MNLYKIQIGPQHMSLPFHQTFHDKIDFCNAILQQKNMCPICHLPLIFSNSQNLPARGLDDLWVNISKTMKEGINQNTNHYGMYNTKSNVEKCHYVSKTMIPEVTRSFLYEPPAIGGEMYPEKIYYLNFNNNRLANDKPFSYDFRALLYHVSQRKVNRAIGFFNISATRFFYGCRDCNAIHTGHHQVRNVTIDSYNLIAQNLRNTPSCCNMYTLIFDCMAECDGQSNRILVDRFVCSTWLIRVWVYYCTIMFFAQNEAAYNRSKLHVDYRARPKIYYFHYAHRDIGICDFYMSQIICAFLFSNFDVEFDFLYLHQNFFSILPLWAERNQKFITPLHNYHSLWRMVMGCDETANVVFPVCTDLAFAPGSSKYQQGNNMYWLHSSEKQNICRKIATFASTWVDIIGNVMEIYSSTQDINATNAEIDNRYPADNTVIKDLFQFYYDNCVLFFAKSKTMVGFRDQNNQTYLNIVAAHPDLHSIHDLFRAQNLPKIMFYNYVKLSLPRHRAVLFLYDHVLDDPNQPVETKILKKYTDIRNFVLELITI